MKHIRRLNFSPERDDTTKLSPRDYSPRKESCSLYLLIENTFIALNNSDFFSSIKSNEVALNFMKVLHACNIEKKFVNFCIIDELQKKDDNSLFRENTPTVSCILDYISDLQGRDDRIIHDYVALLVKDYEYDDDEISKFAMDIVEHFFHIVKCYPSSFFYVLNFIKENCEAYGKDYLKIITMLLFLRKINPAIINSNESIRDRTYINKIKIVKQLQNLSNEIVQDVSVTNNIQQQIKDRIEYGILSLNMHKRNLSKLPEIDLDDVLKIFEYLIYHQEVLNGRKDVLISMCKILAIIADQEKNLIVKNTNLLKWLFNQKIEI